MNRRSTNMKRILQLTLTALLAVAVMGGLASPATAHTGHYAYAVLNGQVNTSLPNTAFGVISRHDGSYVTGSYDAVLQATQSTRSDLGWASTAGYYIGVGFCMREYDHNYTYIRTISRADTGPSGQRWWPELSVNRTYILSQTGC
jgi:hypothetical protein